MTIIEATIKALAENKCMKRLGWGDMRKFLYVCPEHAGQPYLLCTTLDEQYVDKDRSGPAYWDPKPEDILAADWYLEEY